MQANRGTLGLQYSFKSADRKNKFDRKALLEDFKRESTQSGVTEAIKKLDSSLKLGRLKSNIIRELADKSRIVHDLINHRKGR
jgi:hypothetical protein